MPEKKSHMCNETLCKQIKLCGRPRALAQPRVDPQQFEPVNRTFPHPHIRDDRASRDRHCVTGLSRASHAHKIQTLTS